MDRAESRRVKYTKSALRDALFELLETKSIDKITVTEICRLADVHRNTFYAHYAAPEDLLREIVEQNDAIIQGLSGLREDGRERVLERLYETTQNDFLVSTHENNDFSFLESATQNAISQNLAELSRACPQLNERTREYLAIAFTYGAGSIVSRWIQQGRKESPEEVADIIFSFGQGIIDAANKMLAAKSDA